MADDEGIDPKHKQWLNSKSTTSSGGVIVIVIGIILLIVFSGFITKYIYLVTGIVIVFCALISPFVWFHRWRKEKKNKK